MGFPNVIYGDYGDEKVAQSTRIGNLPLGTQMILPDGRSFRHAKAGGTALSAGAICCASAGSPGHGNLAGSGLKVSATTTRNLSTHTDVYLATSLATFTTDQFADGFMNVAGPAASSYIGHIYKVESNLSAASVQAGGDLHLKLYKTDPLKVTLAPTSCTVSLKANPYSQVIVNPGASPVCAPIGATVVAVSANFYHWIQRHGEASIHQAATVCVVGQGVIPSMTEAGSITVAFSAATGTPGKIGWALEGVTASESVLVMLDME